MLVDLLILGLLQSSDSVLAQANALITELLLAARSRNPRVPLIAYIEEALFLLNLLPPLRRRTKRSLFRHPLRKRRSLLPHVLRPQRKERSPLQRPWPQQGKRVWGRSSQRLR